jgi:mercuric ion binding protein
MVKSLMTGVAVALTLALGACQKSGPPETPKPAMQMAADKAGNGKSASLATSNDPNVIKVSVPTMQCETCAKAIKGGIHTAMPDAQTDVDVDTKTVFVKVANNTPETQKQIEEAISKTGYSTTSVKRNDAAYKGLPDCCKDGGAHKD